MSSLCVPTCCYTVLCVPTCCYVILAVPSRCYVVLACTSTLLCRPCVYQHAVMSSLCVPTRCYVVLACTNTLLCHPCVYHHAVMSSLCVPTRCYVILACTITLLCVYTITLLCVCTTTMLYRPCVYHTSAVYNGTFPCVFTHRKILIGLTRFWSLWLVWKWMFFLLFEVTRFHAFLSHFLSHTFHHGSANNSKCLKVVNLTIRSPFIFRQVQPD